MKKLLVIGLLSLGTAILAGCGAGLGGVDTDGGTGTGGTGTGGTGTGGGTTTGRYSGAHYQTVRKLLSYVTWSSAANGAPSGASWDKIQNGSCIRDQYVAAATSYAWAAEAYTHAGESAKAAASATSMCAELKKADPLCSSAPVVGGGSACITEQIYSCPGNSCP